MNNNAEKDFLHLLVRIQHELSDALNSLGGQRSNTSLNTFVLYMAKHINTATEAYIFLRTNSRLDASKLCIRPLVEVGLRLAGVITKPELLYRIAYTDRMEDRKMLRAAPKKVRDDYDTTDEIAWREYTKRYAAEFPTHTLTQQELSLFDLAAAAKLEWYYNSAYRVYCRFTHGAFAAATGALDYTDEHDNWAVSVSALFALDALTDLGATSPNLAGLRDEFHRRAQADEDPARG
jgi:hypothetical protein